jgi:hypothetical protein
MRTSAPTFGPTRAIWSQWQGYLAEDQGARLKADLAASGVTLETIHTSCAYRKSDPGILLKGSGQSEPE